jgi:hypothetical protein
MAHEDVLLLRSQNGEGPARRPLPLRGKWLNRAILDVSHNRRFATPRVGITSAFGTFETMLAYPENVRSWVEQKSPSSGETDANEPERI